MAKEQLTGIALRNGRLEWTSLAGAKNRLRVLGSGDVDAAGLVSGPGESVAEGEAARDLDRVARECRAIKGTISAGLAAEHALLRVVDLPSVDLDEIAGMVELQVDKFSPFPIETMVVSHEILETRETNTRVLVAAARKAAAESLGDTLSKVGIYPRRLDVSVLGWWQLLADEGCVPGEGRALFLLLDGGVPEVIVSQEGRPLLFRALGETEGLDGEMLVEELVREIGYLVMSLELEHGPADAASITIWHRGGVPGSLDTRLSAECGAAVTARDLGDLPPVSEGLARRLAAPGPVQMDLTPPSLHAAAHAQSFKRKVGGATAAIFGLWVLVVGGFLGLVQYDRFRLEELKRQRDEWQEPAMQVNEMRARVRLIRRYMDRRQSVLECLREVALAKPDGIDLTSFSYRREESVKLNAQAARSPMIFQFKRMLDESEVFTEVKLGDQVRDKFGKERFDMELVLGERTP